METLQNNGNGGWRFQKPSPDSTRLGMAGRGPLADFETDRPNGHFVTGEHTKPLKPNPRLPASAFCFIVTAAK
jgi:hypothetical protein